MAASKEITFADRLRYIWNALIHFAPVAALLSAVGLWYTNNRQFGSFLIGALVANAVIGGVRHFKFDTFNLWKCFCKNLELAAMVLIVFYLLEMLRLTLGDNIAGNSFKVLIQVMSLMYPISKSLKNIFILSKGKYPPEFLMTKLYNFEKNGDLSQFFSTDKTSKDETK